MTKKSYHLPAPLTEASTWQGIRHLLDRSHPVFSNAVSLFCSNGKDVEGTPSVSSGLPDAGCAAKIAASRIMHRTSTRAVFMT